MGARSSLCLPKLGERTAVRVQCGPANQRVHHEHKARHAPCVDTTSVGPASRVDVRAAIAGEDGSAFAQLACGRIKLLFTAAT